MKENEDLTCAIDCLFFLLGLSFHEHASDERKRKDELPTPLIRSKTWNVEIFFFIWYPLIIRKINKSPLTHFDELTELLQGSVECSFQRASIKGMIESWTKISSYSKREWTCLTTKFWPSRGSAFLLSFAVLLQSQNLDKHRLYGTN